LAAYFAIVYQQVGSYEAAGEHLGVDRRTVRRYIDLDFLEQLTS